MNREISLFLDCGAPSLFNELVRVDKGTHTGSHFKARHMERDRHGYITTARYKKYRRDYVRFVKKYQKYIDVYSNLDVVNNAEATWENQLYLESKGLHPIPVFHVGEKERWLKHYIDNGYDYIAIGGIVPNPPNVIAPILDKLFANYICDSSGMPIVMTHGFAVTSLRLMLRYPWYSVDSTSWVMTGRFGGIYVPRLGAGGKYEYLKNSWKVCVSARSPQVNNELRHITTIPEIQRRAVLDYVDHKGYILGKSEFHWERPDYELEENEKWFGKEVVKGKHKGKRLVEVILEQGLCNDYKLRDELNIIYFCDLENHMPKWPWRFKPKRHTGEGFLNKHDMSKYQGAKYA